MYTLNSLIEFIWYDFQLFKTKNSIRTQFETWSLLQFLCWVSAAASSLQWVCCLCCQDQLKYTTLTSIFWGWVDTLRPDCWSGPRDETKQQPQTEIRLTKHNDLNSSFHCWPSSTSSHMLEIGSHLYWGCWYQFQNMNCGIFLMTWFILELQFLCHSGTKLWVESNWH